MREIEPPFGNPYWDEHIKPHKVSVDEILGLAFASFQNLMASAGVAIHYADVSWDADPTEIPAMLARHRDRSERELSNLLLRLSILVRTLDDQMRASVFADRYKAHWDDANQNVEQWMVVFAGKKIPMSVRECCNKIVHALDFRPVYNNEDAPREDGGFYMTGELELEGERAGQNWKISIFLPEFLESITKLCSNIEDVMD